MSRPILVCFAVPQEATPFQKKVRGRTDVSVLVTGMGARNAQRAVLKALKEIQPARIFSCGFAGALNPDLKIGDVLFDCTEAALAEQLRAAGAIPARFCCAERVAVTAGEKASLRRQTGADAVEMESAVIARLGAEAGVPCATVRTVSDLASENLPLDFNRLMTPEQKLCAGRLTVAILKAPHRLPALWKLGRNSAFAAEQLAAVLEKAIQKR